MARNQLSVYKDIYTNLEECIDILFGYLDRHESMALNKREGMLRDIQILITVQKSFDERGE